MESKLENLCETNPKFLKKGGLCVGLVVTEVATKKGLPIDPESMRTAEKGQVAGLGKATVQKILQRHDITKVLAEEGGRTSRGSMKLMETYIAFLNKNFDRDSFDGDRVERWWIKQVQNHFASEGPKFHFDGARSVQANIQRLLDQAKDLQNQAQGTNYVGALLQHLVGAKLDLVVGNLNHHGFSVADSSTKRHGDFDISGVAIHVTTAPSEALIRKCSENIQQSLKPVIITLPTGVAGAQSLLNGQSLDDRVDVLDVAQFLTANVYERSLFKTEKCKATLQNVIERYNQIVAECETDPSLRIVVK